MRTATIVQARVGSSRLPGKVMMDLGGATILARVVQRRKIGRGWYLNTGTWASLMRLKPEDLRNEETFKPVYERLEKAETIESLGELAWSRPTVAVIQNGADPCLRQVEPRNGAVQLKDPE